jgi:hypothetical protein
MVQPRKCVLLAVVWEKYLWLCKCDDYVVLVGLHLGMLMDPHLYAQFVNFSCLSNKVNRLAIHSLHTHHHKPYMCLTNCQGNRSTRLCEPFILCIEIGIPSRLGAYISILGPTYQSMWFMCTLRVRKCLPYSYLFSFLGFVASHLLLSPSLSKFEFAIL